jgi:hypothetical protein
MPRTGVVAHDRAPPKQAWDPELKPQYCKKRKKKKKPKTGCWTLIKTLCKKKKTHYLKNNYKILLKNICKWNPAVYKNDEI